jgi:NAD(P)-dependent dehydrogenase (short-subunit alcohol dehydrogenase family)
MGEFEGKVVLVTGAGQGFGRLAAQRFAEAGAAVVLGDIDRDKLTETGALVAEAGGRAILHPCDVASESDVKALVAAAGTAFGGLDIAVNNAGIVHDMARLPDLSFADFQKMMAVNAGGVFLGMKYQIPALLARGGGAIVNISSAAGLLGAPMLSAYAASKHAVIGLSRAAADEYARRNIRINAVCPSFAATRMGESGLTALGGTREEAIAKMTARVPMRRMGRPEEVVEAILWLASDRSSFVTGQALAVDGGLTAV